MKAYKSDGGKIVLELDNSEMAKRLASLLNNEGENYYVAAQNLTFEQMDKERQEEYNKKHDITPKSIVKPMRDRLLEKIEEEVGHEIQSLGDIPQSEKKRLVKELTERMNESATNLDFEQAAKYRDQIKELGS